MTDVELLRAAIQAKGGSARAFARFVVFRNERTVRRWLAGEAPLPREVRLGLEKMLTPVQEGAPP